MRFFRLGAAVCIACCAIPAHADIVERRGGEPELQGKVIRVDESGVSVERNIGEVEFVRWDRVRRVESPTYAREIQQYEEVADQLWRARTRLERGDAALAEPIFERLFERYKGRKDESALVVAEGLLRCRLARGSNDQAVIPALEAARLRRTVNASSAIYASLRPVIDQRTALCMFVPPAFATAANLSRIERELAAYDAQGDTVIAALALLYRQAIRQQLGMPPASDDRALAADQPGVIALKGFIELGSSDSAKRSAAREDLLKRLPTLEPWMQAWAHYGIGVSLLAESGEGRQKVGLVQLAHLPSRFSRDQSFLAGLALARMIQALDAQGDPASADILLNDLKENFPNHPAIAGVRSRPAGSGTSAT